MQGGELCTFAVAPAPGVTMESWIACLVLAALLGVAEVMTATLALGLLAVAALVAAIVGSVGGSCIGGEVWSPAPSRRRRHHAPREMGPPAEHGALTSGPAMANHRPGLVRSDEYP